MSNDRVQSVDNVLQAVAKPDEKIDPGEAPVVEFIGALNMPSTEGKTLLTFKAGESTVGVRMDSDELEKMKRNLGAF